MVSCVRPMHCGPGGCPPNMAFVPYGGFPGYYPTVPGGPSMAPRTYRRAKRKASSKKGSVKTPKKRKVSRKRSSSTKSRGKGLLDYGRDVGTGMLISKDILDIGSDLVPYGKLALAAARTALPYVKPYAEKALGNRIVRCD